MYPILKTLCLTLITAGFLSHQTRAQNTSVSSAEAEKLSIQLEESVNKGDPETLNQLIYFPEFVKRLKSRSHFKDDVDTLTKIAIDFGLFKIGNRTVEEIKNGSFNLVRGFTKNEETHLLFRAFGDGGVNYIDITLTKVKDSVRAADIFSFQLGESYTRLFSYRIADLEVPDAHSSMTSREKYGAIFQTAVTSKNYSVAKAAFEKFDEQTQNDRHFSIQYMLVCQQLNEKASRRSAERMIALFPEEPAPYLLLMNGYADSKDYRAYSQSIDRLDSILHTDPFLNYYRGNVSMKLNDSRAGLHFYQLVFDYDPGIWQNTEKLVACKVVNNELVQANEAIAQYIHTPGYRKELVEALYADFPALK